MSKTCAKMGFTEKASCRPYKNCYKSKMNGGASSGKSSVRQKTQTRSKPKANAKPKATKPEASKPEASKPKASKPKATKPKSKAKTKKAKTVASGNIMPSKKHMNAPAFVYHSEHVTYTSHPNANTPYGKRTVVNIENGVGKKQFEVLDKHGQIIKTDQKKLNDHEVNELKQGNYVPRLWVGLGV